MVLIDPGLYLAFVGAVAVLMLLPGPNVALIVSNSIAHGPRYGLMTVLGTCAAMVVQLALTAGGMSHLLGAAGGMFAWLRWIGAVYLVWLGVSHWRAPPVDLTRMAPQAKSGPAILRQAAVVSLTNPKTLLFYGALFPQFVTAKAPLGPQFALLAATFLVLAAVIDSGWALAAGRARGLLAANGVLRNRLSGGLLIGGGAALALLRNR